MTHEKIGRVLKSEIDPVVEYTDHLADTIKGDLSGLRVAGGLRKRFLLHNGGAPHASG